MTDPVKLYLRDIKNIPLLNAEDERRLGEEIRRGSRKARKQLIQANLRLVINMAKRYSRFGVPIADLIEEGNLGLIRAVSKFNPRHGYRFSTYCAWWVKQYIMRALSSQGRTIKIPVYVTEIIARYRRCSEELTHKLGRPPTDKEIARRLGLPLNKVKGIEEAIGKIQSLDAGIGEDGRGQLLDIFSEEAPTEQTVDELKDFLWRERISALLAKMTKREREVLLLRFGLDDGITRTLREVAEELKITRERVRQIEDSAMRKMRRMIIEAGGEEGFAK